jgi:septum formation protein
MKVILASKSPRRKELMDLLGIEYEIMVSEADETLEEGLSLEEQSKKLGYVKAKAVFDKTTGDRIIIGSDTMVIKNGKLFGKPKDKQDAVNMLNILKNDKHQVITSIAILVERNGKYEEHIDCDISNVYVSDMTDREIEKWIEIGNVYDKAGAYAIQSSFGVFVDKVEGNYSTVIGFPINKVYQILKQYI